MVQFNLSQMWLAFMFLVHSVQWCCAETATNHPPQIRIVFPESGRTLFAGLYTKIKTDVIDPDGSITEVRFYINDLLVGTVTNAPYDFLAYLRTPDRHFKAIARDDKGAETVSAPVYAVVSQAPVGSIAILEPEHGTIVPARTDLELRADVVAVRSRGFRNQVAFYLDGRTVGSVDAGPINTTHFPVTLTLTNLVEGEHDISVGLLTDCACPTHTIRAVNLAIRDPILTPDHELDFEVITAFRGTPTVIEYSTDFDHWTQLQTITPETNYFRFTAPIEPGTSHRWYRVSLVETPMPINAYGTRISATAP